MKSRRAAVIAATVLAGCGAARTAFLVYPDAEVAGVKSAHEYKGKPLCQACHLDESPKLKADEVMVCGRCHAVDHGGGHRPNSIIKNAAEVGLPLPGGRLVCHTCHDPHDLKRNKHGFREPIPGLCLHCHKGH
ncbi:MAG: cytochrome c3 family protein [Myxococcaceae bacterium]